MTSTSHTAPGLFVTGTDTGVGKTAVAAGLLRLALRAGLRPIPSKPVETGCDPTPMDAALLWEAAGRPGSLASVCPHPFRLPAAPAVAAAAAGALLDVSALATTIRARGGAGDLLIVEGAGGLLVPYAGADTAADLAARLKLPILLVARTALGTINHTALTIRELARQRLPLAGLVLVQTTPERFPHESTNAEMIERLTNVAPLGTIPYLAPAHAADPAALADAVLAGLGPTTTAALLGLSPAQTAAGRLFG